MTATDTTTPEDQRDSRNLRVAQWATGNIGTRALRAVIEHPSLDLRAVHVHSDDKDGADAGALCGLEPTGMAATRSIEAVVEADVDCVLYMPRACDIDEVCRLLASGANVVTTRGEFHHPASMDPEVRARVEAACEIGGTSIHSTGSSPGFVTEALPLVLTSIQRRLDHLAIDEYADLSQRDSPGLLFDVMGFGGDPAAVAQQRVDHLRASFGPSLRLLADGLGVPLDDVTATGDLAPARRTITIAAGTIDQGAVAAQRVTVSGVREGRELLRFSATWYCTTDIDWDVRDTGWHVTVDGDAPLDIDLRFPVPLERMAAVSPGYTANRAVNAIAAVCAAEPGIRTTLDLPQVVAAL
ncbi:dihydrodipicolinate reductase [Rhodococcus gannanensis]|uniref:Dihydrodipicolinate reductase n=1 Tax=Rhodococcus gannanensis TaxID=1960308 RepID=A0ABW4P7U1_9NOCA